MFRTKTAAGTGEDQAPTDQATTTGPDFAAMAEWHQREAELASERAAQGRADAQAIIDAAERDAAQRTAAARAAALGVTAEAAAAEREAGELTARANLLTHAAGLEVQADDAGRKVSDLVAERDQLLERVAELDGGLAQVEVEQQDLDGQLGRARDAGDLDALTAAMGRIDAAQFLAADLNVKRATAQDRLDALGDEAGTGELANSRETASEAHKAVRRIRNELDPTRPEAVHDRALDELQGALAGNLERMSAEAAASQRKPPQQIVHVGE